MLKWRLTLGSLFIAILAALCWIDSQASPTGIVLLPLGCVVAVLCSREICSLLAARGVRPRRRVVNTTNLALTMVPALIAWWGSERLRTLPWPLLVMAAGLIWAFAEELQRYKGPGKSLERLAVTIFPIAYVGLLMSFLVELRLLGRETSNSLGLHALGSLIVVVKMCDTGAYTVGRLLGRHKLAPLVSPGKTIEGAIGGVAFAFLGAWFALRWLPDWTRLSLNTPFSATEIFSFGLIVGIAGMLGDLSESLVKRDVRKKDSSTWLPGFGGVLDILDSILLGAPAAYVCWFIHLGL